MESDKTLVEFLSLVQVENFDGLYDKDIVEGSYFGMPLKAIVESEKRLRSLSGRCIAYFSMEYGLATSFYNKFKSHRAVSPNNRNQEQEVFPITAWRIISSA
jgi:hypothetical protein